MDRHTGSHTSLLGRKTKGCPDPLPARGHAHWLVTVPAVGLYVSYITWQVMQGSFAPDTDWLEGKEFQVCYLVSTLVLCLVTLVLAEVFWRLCLVVEELRHVQHRYDGRVSAALIKTLRPAYPVILGMVLLVCIVLTTLILIISQHGHIAMQECWENTHNIFLTIFIFNSIVAAGLGLRGLSAPERDRELEKSSFKELANGLAWCIFSGFIEVIVPDIFEKKRQLRRAWEGRDMSKLVILIPESCLIPKEPPSNRSGVYCMEKAGEVLFSKDVGGVSRNYDQTVYVISKSGEEKCHCFVAYATLLQSLFLMSDSQVAQLSAGERKRQVQLFTRRLATILALDDNIAGKVVLVYLQREDEEAPSEQIYRALQEGQ